jgi:hypothetical protein
VFIYTSRMKFQKRPSSMPAQICASATLFPLIAPIAGDYISIDQSALTGESLPVSKKRSLFQPL